MHLASKMTTQLRPFHPAFRSVASGRASGVSRPHLGRRVDAGRHPHQPLRHPVRAYRFDRVDINTDEGLPLVVAAIAAGATL